MAKSKLSAEVSKQEKVKKEKQQKAEDEVLKSPALRAILVKDKKRQNEYQQSTLELWWERGADVVSIRRAQTENGERAEYGRSAITNLALALGYEPRAFHRAADFYAMFEEDTPARKRFFRQIKQDHGFDLHWTHIETVIKYVSPVKSDPTDQAYKDMLILAAEEKLTVSGLEKELTRRFKSNRKPARKISPYDVLAKLNRIISEFRESSTEVFAMMEEVFSVESLNDAADPSSLLTKVTDTQRDLMSLDQTIMDQETKFSHYRRRLTERIEVLRQAQQAESEEAQAEAAQTTAPEPEEEPAGAAA